jgi:hypothetical protein
VAVCSRERKTTAPPSPLFVLVEIENASNVGDAGAILFFEKRL